MFSLNELEAMPLGSAYSSVQSSERTGSLPNFRLRLRNPPE
jgi:hypothetical protein